MENEMENEMMMDAVRDGDIETLELLLEQGSDPNFIDQFGTALGNAIRGNIDIVRLLLDWGADPNLSDQFGTVLKDAALYGNIDIIRLLLDRGVDPNIRTDNGYTALMGAVTILDTDMVRLLLDRGADPNIRTNTGYTALMLAINRGNADIVTLLMRYMTTIRMQSLHRGKMTRRKLNTSMARKRSSTSQLGDRYALGEDIIHRLNSHMTRPSHVDMIDEIPRNMTGSIKRSKRKFAKRTKKRKPKRF
jgi:hypothetical protein